jgi:hypothetical protein
LAFKKSPVTMRLLFTTAVALFLSSFALASTDLSGTWVLDLRSSTPSGPMLKRLGVSWLERKLADSIQLDSIYTQTPGTLTIHTKGPAFGRTEVIRTDNQPETKEEKLTGRYNICTDWIARGTELVSTISFRTKDQRDAQLVVNRQLADGGKTLILTQTLKVAGEAETWTVRRIWRKRER